jgi:hypothetical protein
MSQSNSYSQQEPISTNMMYIPYELETQPPVVIYKEPNIKKRKKLKKRLKLNYTYWYVLYVLNSIIIILLVITMIIIKNKK